MRPICIVACKAKSSYRCDIIEYQINKMSITFLLIDYHFICSDANVMPTKTYNIIISTCLNV